MAAVDELTLLDQETPPPRRPVPPVTEDDGPVSAVVERMLYIICRTGHPSLCGPQVGFDRRIVAVDLSGSGERPVVLINPEIESTSVETQVDTEGCLYHPGVLKRVERPVHATVTGRAPSGQDVRLLTGGFLARVLQHQIDHLEGRAFGGGKAAGDVGEPARAGGDRPDPRVAGGEGGDDRPVWSCSMARAGRDACRIS